MSEEREGGDEYEGEDEEEEGEEDGEDYGDGDDDDDDEGMPPDRLPSVDFGQDATKLNTNLLYPGPSTAYSALPFESVPWDLMPFAELEDLLKFYDADSTDNAGNPQSWPNAAHRAFPPEGRPAQLSEMESKDIPHSWPSDPDDDGDDDDSSFVGIRPVQQSYTQFNTNLAHPQTGATSHASFRGVGPTQGQTQYAGVGFDLMEATRNTPRSHTQPNTYSRQSFLQYGVAPQHVRGFQQPYPPHSHRMPQLQYDPYHPYNQGGHTNHQVQ